MIYDNIKTGRFISRPNRFIANIEIDGKAEVCHVKNTGRCKELLTENAAVFVQKSNNPLRKTKYDLISVYKKDLLVNIDSQAPNKVFHEWLSGTDYFGDITLIKPECKYKNSRFDFYVETNKRKIFIEVKGVTLEHNGIASFPDAPTERGVKHIRELCDCMENGYEAYIFFIIQMKGMKAFTPNRIMHPEFADELTKAEKSGVNIKCLDCTVTPETLEINSFINYHERISGNEKEFF